MVRAMTEAQFDKYLSANGYGICSEESNVAYVAHSQGSIVAMYWKGKQPYIETLEEEIEPDYMNPANWDAEQRQDAVLCGLLTVTALFLFYIVILIFA